MKQKANTHPHALPVCFLTNNIPYIAMNVVIISTIPQKDVLNGCTATNLLRNIGIGIGCVFLLWLFLTSSITRILPQLLQLFKLSGEVVQDGFLTPYWPSRILYAVVAIGLLFLNLYLVNKQPDYNKKGWCKHGNKGK